MSHSVSGPTETSELSNLTADFPDEVDLRLVVADMDGTLLDGQGRVPRRLDTVVARMHEHGVVFVPASGRQLANLRATLGATITQSPIIAENGTIVVQGDAEIHRETITRSDAVAAVRTARALREQGFDVGPVIATRDRAYVDRIDERFVRQCAFYYAALEPVEDVLDLALDNVLKIAVYAFGDAESECYGPLSAAVPGVQTVVSGVHWVDMMPRTASKGRALAAVQERLGITPAQTAVFGDYLNDAELYDYSELSFAMANAHPGILSRARYIAPANTDDGVLRTIETLLDRLSPR
jgi:HAD hydrolase, family IIB